MSKKLSTIVGGGVTSTGALPVANGGTGSTTVATALTALGAQELLVSGTNVKSVNGTSLLGSGNLVVTSGLGATAIKTAAYTAAANDLVRCDTSAGAFNITLPASPADGVMIGIVDIAGTFGTNNLTILPNTSKTIESDATSYNLDISGASVTFVYNTSTTNWRLMETPSAGTTTVGSSFSAPTYSYTGIELLKPMFISKPAQSISYNGVLSQITGSMETLFGVFPTTEIDETVYTYNGINVEGFAFTHGARTQTVNFPNLKINNGTMSVGSLSGDVLAANFPELLYSGQITIIFSPVNVLIASPVQNTLNLSKLKVVLGININYYAGTTYTLPQSLEFIGTAGVTLSNFNNLTSFTIPNTPNAGKWEFNFLYNISTLDTSQVVNCGGIIINQCVLLTALNFNNLQTVGSGGVFVGYSPNITSLSFPLLKNSGGALSFTLLQRCTTLTLPELVYSAGGITISNMTALTALSFPKLVKAGDINVSNNLVISSFSAPLLQVLFNGFTSNFQYLTSFSLPSLKIVNGVLNLTGTATMSVDLSALEKVYGTFNLATFSTVNLNALKEVTDALTITPGAASTVISLPNIVSIATKRFQDSTLAINIAGTGVTSFTFGTTLKRVGCETAGNVSISNHALTQASVDNILVRLAALDGTNGTYVFKNRYVSVGGGTSSTPSATGLAAKATLVARGCGVSHN
jgi:hypothetical protein